MARALSPADIFSFRSLADARISADGGRIVATLTRRDMATDMRAPVLIQSTDRAAWTEIVGSAGVITARIAPDGRRVAFLRRRKDRWELAVFDGTTRTLHESAAPLRELAWSPDGRVLAFQERVDADLPAWLGLLTPPEGAVWAPPPRHTSRLLYRHDAVGELPEHVFHVFLVPADGSAAPRQLTRGPWHFGLPHHVPPGLVFSADGRELLLAGTQAPDWDERPSDTDIHALNVANGAVRRMTEISGATAHPAPSPDGAWLAFTAVEHRGLSHQLRRLFVMPMAGGPAREVAPGLDRSLVDIAWAADSGSLLVGYDDAGAHHVARVSLDGTVRVLAEDVGSGAIEMPYGGGTFTVARDGTLTYVRTASDLPSDVAVVTPNGDRATLTAVNAELAAEIGGFRAAEMMWVAGAEGRRVQAWLTLPEGLGPHPIILEIHGGPYAQYGDRFSIKYQCFVAAGYAVLSVNPAGSTGYGEDFANALHDRFPGPDWEDLMAALDVACARPDIDARRQFITGVSGGGVLTCWSVTHTHRFRAAVAIKPVTDWQAWVLGADIGASVGLTWMGNVKPWEDPAKYRARSPLSYAQDARTPTLVMVGESDSRTPASEGMMMYAALRLAGVEAHLMRFPGTSHSSGAMRPSLFAAEISASIGWFGRFQNE
jgi:dipeptidyl aminopeptidase/acylaminoacyl peptidase